MIIYWRQASELDAFYFDSPFGKLTYWRSPTDDTIWCCNQSNRAFRGQLAVRSFMARWLQNKIRQQPATTVLFLRDVEGGSMDGQGIPQFESFAKMQKEDVLLVAEDAPSGMSWIYWRDGRSMPVVSEDIEVSRHDREPN